LKQPWAEISQRLRRYDPGLELANAFGVIKLERVLNYVALNRNAEGVG